MLIQFTHFLIKCNLSSCLSVLIVYRPPSTNLFVSLLVPRDPHWLLGIKGSGVPATRTTLTTLLVGPTSLGHGIDAFEPNRVAESGLVVDANTRVSEYIHTHVTQWNALIAHIYIYTYT